MAEYAYLIVGGGMTAAAAVQGIRAVDRVGTIGLIGDEPDAPYDRPPLSKALWKGKPLDSVWRTIQKDGLTFLPGRVVQSIDVREKCVRDDRQELHKFGRLLLATGGRPRRLGFGGEDIIYFRTVADYRRLRDLSERFQRFAVVGGGFIGSEIAAALAMNHKKVTLIFPGNGIGGRAFPRELSQFLNDYYRKKGVDVLAGQSAVGLKRAAGGVVLQTSGGRGLEVDGVVAGIGIEPNVELARAAGLAVADGIVVNERLQTSHPDIYASGDVASFQNPALGKRIRVEHEDNANTMGEMAGKNMAGQAQPYQHLPFFYSDLFELGYEAVGELDARLETVVDWKTPFQEGVIYYLRAGRVCGVLLWNVWGQVDAARALIAQPGPFQPRDLKGKLPGKS